MPEVIVMIPTYNSAEFLGEALQGVSNQTFSDYEIIVGDDGSADRTRQVMDIYGNQIEYLLSEISV